MNIQMIIEQLEKAIRSLKHEDMDYALSPIYKHKDITPFIPTLIEALKVKTHQRHEDIVMLFQQAKDPRTNQILYATTFKLFKHLEYDVNFGLARKCTWALADIGTKESMELLKIIAKDKNQTIAKFAQKRLEHWDKELHRKGKDKYS